MAVVLPFRAAGGAQSEVIVVPAASAARIPDGVSIEAAATLPMNGLTALEALDISTSPSTERWRSPVGLAGLRRSPSSSPSRAASA
jgi:NADPH:quinone reductase-like Zn-dependent oxidoreductase